MLKEFKQFVMRGNVFDLAVGIVIGAAFGKIITSLVEDIIMPPIGLLLGGINFADFFINLSGKSYATLTLAKADGAATINYGLFFNNIINFLIVALALFLIIRQVNRLKGVPEPPAPTEKECPYCLSAVPIQASRCKYCTSELVERQ